MLRYTLAIIAAFATLTTAQASSELAHGSLQPGWRDGATHVAGLTIRLQPGWKTYWRAPGDAGIPPRFNWSGSQNVRAIRVQFPVPEIMDQNGIRSIGYHDQVTFPLWIEPLDPSQPIALRGEIDIGVCEEICVPITLNVRANLPMGGKPNGTLASAIKNRPASGAPIRCGIEPIADGLKVRVETALPAMTGEQVAIIETANPEIWVSPALISRQGNTLVAVVEMVAPTAQPFALARNDLVMTVLADGRAIETRGCD